MVIEAWRMSKLQEGNTVAAEAGQRLIEQYGDVSLRTTEVSVFEEAVEEIQRFSPEAREALEAKGMIIVELTGQSIKTLRDVGNPFSSTWHQNNPQFEALTSRHSEVAIIPELFLPKSNRKTLDEQEKLIDEFSKTLKIKGVEAITGEAPDYIEFAFTHLAKTGTRLFGENFGYNYTRTKTPTTKSRVASVGFFGAQGGLHVRAWDRGNGDGRVFVAPLVVPA